MTIPDWDRNHLIPPIRPGTSEESGSKPSLRSPYEADLETLIERFAITRDRATLLRGFLDYRAALHQAGLIEGFQWVDGSLVEHVEDRENKPHTPNDIDVVTYYYLPDGLNSLDPNFLALFYPVETKQKFHVDAYGIELGQLLNEGIVADIGYYWGLFSHRSQDWLWKGFVQIGLRPEEDKRAREMLDYQARIRGWT